MNELVRKRFGKKKLRQIQEKGQNGEIKMSSNFQFYFTKPQSNKGL